VLRWKNNGTRNPAVPQDHDNDATYVIEITATDHAGLSDVQLFKAEPP
jgi:hypothetical protein